MKKTRGLILVMVIIVAILLGGTPVKAADYTVKASLSADAELTAGSTINVAFGFSSIDVGENPGISGMTADIDYDTTVFEPISADTMEGKAGWSAAYSKHLVLSRMAGCSKTTGTVVVIPFKVLSTSTAKETTITINNIKVAGTSGDWNSGDISVDPVSVTIKAPSTGSDTENPTTPTNPLDPSNPSGTDTDGSGAGSGTTTGTDSGNGTGNGAGSTSGTSNNGSNGSTTSNDTKSTSTDKTTSSKKIPAAGLNTYVVSAIVVVAIAGTIGFVLYARLKKEIK